MAPKDTLATANAHAPVRRYMRGARVLLAVFAFAYHGPVAAWGDEGHEIIGLIAEHFLKPEIRRRVIAILATDQSGLTPNTGIASEATWADRFRDSDRDSARIRYRGTRNWHFIDLELTGADLERGCDRSSRSAMSVLASQGPADDCIVHKIDEFRRELADPKTSTAERRVALQFLLHLVGDVHQPLHAADDHDEGGNKRWVEDPAGRHGTLHSYWDNNLVRELGPDPERVAAAILLSLSSADYARDSGGTAASWALGSYALARQSAYGALPRALPDGRIRLTAAYVTSGTAAVRQQLELAGLRLARLLNTALR